MHQSKQKLKFVEWEKINRRQLNNTIWEDLGEESSEEEEDLLFHNQSLVTKLSRADVFTMIETTFAQKPAIDLSKRKRKSDVIELLDSRKAYNMSIFLTSLPKEFEIGKFSEYLNKMASCILEEHVLDNLIKFAPEKEEEVKLKRYAETQSVHLLSLPDQLMLQMLNVPQYKHRVMCLLFKLTFWETIETIQKNLEIMLKASIELRQAKSFRLVLKQILVLGNYMNGNTNRGGASGFKIHSINKVSGGTFAYVGHC